MVSSLLRPVISLALLIGALWFAFAVKLGDRTFAEHIDRIGETPAAHDLIEGTRATVNPVLQEATDRMLGEHIEAPVRGEGKASTHASAATKTAARPSTADDVKLPGRG